MINYETILSNYDDKLTLMQWLKKVDTALGEASLSSIEVTNPTTTTGKIKLIFADGTSVESAEYALNPAIVDEIYAALASDSNIVITKENDKVKISFASNIRVNNLIVLGDVAVQGGVTIGQGQETARINGNVVVTGDIEQEGEGEINCNFIDTNSLLVQENAEVSGDLHVGGNVTGGSIIENMSGYSVSGITYPKEGLTIRYVSAVKNGNKLTFVIAGKVARPVGTAWTDYTQLLKLNFIIPESVGAKIYPMSAGGNDKLIAGGLIQAIYNFRTRASLNADMAKYSNTTITAEIYATAIDTFTEAQDYAFRYEQTFLLNDSLI